MIKAERLNTRHKKIMYNGRKNLEGVKKRFSYNNVCKEIKIYDKKIHKGHIKKQRYKRILKGNHFAQQQMGCSRQICG